MPLAQLDEGSGDVLNDSSGNNHDGKIIGAKWVKVEGGNSPAEIDLLPLLNLPQDRLAGEWIIDGAGFIFDFRKIFRYPDVLKVPLECRRQPTLGDGTHEVADPVTLGRAP